jgi:hypothetical protein
MRQRKQVSNGRLLLVTIVVLLGLLAGVLYGLRPLARMRVPRVDASQAAAGGIDAAATSMTAARTVQAKPEDTNPALRDFIAGDGSDTCPVAFPVKANHRSGIYHLPGDLAYERTIPTYCYQAAASAERDGYRHAYR